MSKEDKKKPEAKSEASPEEEAKSSGKKKLIILAIGGSLGLALASAGITFFLVRGSGTKHTEEKHAGEHAEAGHAEAHEPADAEHKDGGDPKEGGDHAKETKKEEHASSEKKDDKDSHKKEAEAKKDAGGDHGKKDEKESHGKGAEPEKKDGHGADSKDAGKGHTDKKSDTIDATTKIDGIDFGCTHTLPPFNLNLGNPLENRFMRMEVSVEYGCGTEAKAELDRRNPQLRDAVTSVARRKTREFMLGSDGLDQLRKEVHIKLNSLLTHKIDKVFITNILIE